MEATCSSETLSINLLDEVPLRFTRLRLKCLLDNVFEKVIKLFPDNPNRNELWYF